MHSYLFAGAIFSAQEVALFLFVAFVITSLVTGLIIFILKNVLDKFSTKSKGINLKFGKAVVAGCVLIAVTALILLIIPTMIKDARWQRRQEECAARVGYQNPGDNNSGLATADSQREYSKCLGV